MKRTTKVAVEILVRVAIGLYGIIDRIFRPRPTLPIQNEDVRRILVIRLDLLGDVVFSLPALEAIVAAFPRAAIDLLVLPYTAPLIRDLPGLHRVIEIDVNAYRRPAGLLELGTLLRAIRLMRATHYDLTFSLSRWMGGLFAVLSGARLRAGTAAETYWGCYNLPLEGHRYGPDQHEVEFCLSLVGQLAGVDPGAGRAPRLPSQLPTARFDLGIEPPYVVILPGASNGSAKRWPAPYWGELAGLLNAAGLRVAVCGTTGERAFVGDFPTGEGVIDLLGQTSIADLIRVLGGSAAVVAGDTGPLHVAAALERPVIGIYGATDPANTGPRGKSVQVLRAGLPCSPCYDLQGPAECKLPDRSVACMWSLKPHEVVAAIQVATGLQNVLANG